MNILLAAVNAKYIHSNLGIYSLKSYAEKSLKALEPEMRPEIGLAEYTINHQTEAVLQDIFKRRPDVIGFSCYIWNISFIKAILADLKKVLPQVEIWLGGPEVSYDADKVLWENPSVTGIMKGEGEETFAELAAAYGRAACARAGARRQAMQIGENTSENIGGHTGRIAVMLQNISGLIFRDPASGEFIHTPDRPLMDLSAIPFSYGHMDLKELEHRIIYYESSRGCPFSCAYCLSSIDKTVRFRSLELVKPELAFFLNAKVPQVKFVDRTFNCKKSHAMAIWQFIRDNDNGCTNFHFEIAADLLDEEELQLLASMRPGLVQLEIGVQSTNPDTLAAIRRKTDIEEIRRITARINSGKNVHQHLDLIAGLPYENIESFRNSFNEVYSMEPEQLQLGFLKVLKGSYMEEMASDCGLLFSDNPPYEVLSTRWLSYSDVLELKAVEDMVEVYYNSRQFTLTLSALEKEYPSPYEMFAAMALFYEKNKLTGISHSRIARYELLWQIIEEKTEKKAVTPKETFRDLLMCDLYLRENVKSRPSFAREQTALKETVKDFFRREEKEYRYLSAYRGYDSRQMANMAHIEVMADGGLVLFDYKTKDPLTGNARAVRLSRERNEEYHA